MEISKQELSVNELMVLNSSMREAEKSLALGYLMLIGGHLGVHRFYLKRYKSAITQLLFFVISTASYFMATIFSDLEYRTPMTISLICLGVIGGSLLVWLVVDLFLVPRMIREWNEQVERDMIRKIYEYRQTKISSDPM
jgi:hypothetical protein